jgi:hypothetical protein
VHCKYRELFVLSMAGKKGPAHDRLLPRVPLFARPARFLFKRVWQTSVYTVAGATNTLRGAVLRVFRDSNNESGVYIGFRANSRSAGYSGSSDSAICLGIAEFTLHSPLRGGRREEGKKIRRANTQVYLLGKFTSVLSALRPDPDEILNRDFGPR